MKYLVNYFHKGQLTKMFFLFPVRAGRACVRGEGVQGRRSGAAVQRRSACSVPAICYTVRAAQLACPRVYVRCYASSCADTATSSYAAHCITTCPSGAALPTSPPPCCPVPAGPSLQGLQPPAAHHKHLPHQRVRLCAGARRHAVHHHRRAGAGRVDGGQRLGSRAAGWGTAPAGCAARQQQRLGPINHPIKCAVVCLCCMHADAVSPLAHHKCSSHSWTQAAAMCMAHMPC